MKCFIKVCISFATHLIGFLIVCTKGAVKARCAAVLERISLLQKQTLGLLNCINTKSIIHLSLFYCSDARTCTISSNTQDVRQSVCDSKANGSKQKRTSLLISVPLTGRPRGGTVRRDTRKSPGVMCADAVAP